MVTDRYPYLNQIVKLNHLSLKTIMRRAVCLTPLVLLLLFVDHRDKKPRKQFFVATSMSRYKGCTYEKQNGMMHEMVSI